MQRKEFIKKMNKAIKETSKGHAGKTYTCNIMDIIDNNIGRDYKTTLSRSGGSFIPVGFGVKREDETVVRLNALTMYMIQALTFKTYKDL